MISFTSSSVVASFTVGPDAMTERLLPGTSEKIRFATVAGYKCFARPPPFTLDKCLRIAFISAIVAPDFKSDFEMALNISTCFSSFALNGASNIADPPPQITTSTKSSSVKFFICSKTFSVK